MVKNKSNKRKEKKRQSCGKIILPEGIYDGETDKGKRHGEGIFKYTNGGVCSV